MTMDNDLIPLEGTQLTNASFRQGCPVYVVGDVGRGDGACNNSHSHSRNQSLPQIENRGTITNVFLKLAELIQTSSRCNMLFELVPDFEVRGRGARSVSRSGRGSSSACKSSIMVTADRLRFQNGCPVHVKLQSTVDNGELAKGIVLGWCDIPFDDDHRKYTSDTFWYSVQIIHDGSHRHNNVQRDRDRDREGKEANKENMEDYVHVYSGEEDEESDMSEEFVPTIMHQVSPKDILYRVVEEAGQFPVSAPVHTIHADDDPSLHHDNSQPGEGSILSETLGDRVSAAMAPDEGSSSIPTSVSIPKPICSLQFSSSSDRNQAKIKKEPEVTLSHVDGEDGSIYENDNDHGGLAALGSPLSQDLEERECAQPLTDEQQQIHSIIAPQGTHVCDKKQLTAPSKLDADTDAGTNVSARERLQNRQEEICGKVNGTCSSGEVTSRQDEESTGNQEQDLHFNEHIPSSDEYRMSISDDGSVNNTDVRTHSGGGGASAPKANKTGPMDSKKDDNHVGHKRLFPTDTVESRSAHNIQQAKRHRTCTVDQGETTYSSNQKLSIPTPAGNHEGARVDSFSRKMSSTRTEDTSPHADGAFQSEVSTMVPRDTKKEHYIGDKRRLPTDSAESRITQSLEAQRSRTVDQVKTQCLPCTTSARKVGQDIEHGSSPGPRQLVRGTTGNSIDQLEGRIPRKSRPEDCGIERDNLFSRQEDDHKFNHASHTARKSPCKVTKQKKPAGDRNPNYRSDIFNHLTDHSRYFSIKEVKTMHLEDPIPKSQQNPSIPTCLSYHVKGVCHNTCRSAEDHHRLTEYQCHNLARWYERNCAIEEDSDSSTRSVDSASDIVSASDRECLTCWELDLPSLRFIYVKPIVIGKGATNKRNLLKKTGCKIIELRARGESGCCIICGHGDGRRAKNGCKHILKVLRNKLQFLLSDAEIDYGGIRNK